jgi:DNA-binding NtrC family response regulator
VLREEIVRAAADPSPALVLGETGVGKERVARELHRLSGRSGPFVAVNVAELSGQLVESQLFGHVKGAFTGAEQAQPGLFRAAHRGTLLLDEIGELPPEMQAKLLRVIQEREVRAVGSTRSEPVDVRVLGATHADLAAAVEAGGFRRDLWGRLSLIELRVPALSARRADIIDWLVILYTRWARERGLGERSLELAPEAAEHLLVRPLRENLRALERVVHRLDPDRPSLGIEVLERALGPWEPTASGQRTRAAAAASFAPPPTTRAELEQALAEVGSVHGLARHYGKHRRQIYRWLELFGLR